ncbi:MAG: molecular chaperone [Bauldia sp.]
MRGGWSFLSLLLAFGAVGSADAASLRIAPVSLNFTAPAAAGSLTLTNSDSAAITVQARVFRWQQRDGKETLEETKDVVVSPPFAKVSPGGNYTIRVLRLAKAPVAGEESYRVLIDQLPEPTVVKDQTVRLLLRYSVPVFFDPATRPKPAVEWAVRRQGDRVMLAVANKGGGRLKLTDVDLVDANGKSTRVSNGLLGYVLSGSSMTWPLPMKAAAMPKGLQSVRYATEIGPVNAPITVKDGR